MRRSIHGFMIITVLACALGLLAGTARAGATKDEVRKILRENPDLVMEVLKEHKDQVLTLVEDAVRARQKAAWRKRVEREIAHPFSPVLDPDRMYLGKKDAPMTIVAYSDFTCHFCAEGYKTILKLLAKHPNELRLLLKQSPRDEYAHKLALTFLAIGRQDPKKAWSFAKQVFAHQDELHKKKGAALDKILDGLHLDRKRLAKDIKDPKLSALVGGDAAEHHRFGFDGTPTYLVNGVSMRGAAPLSQFEEMLSLIKQKGKQ